MAIYNKITISNSRTTLNRGIFIITTSFDKVQIHLLKKINLFNLNAQKLIF